MNWRLHCQADNDLWRVLLQSGVAAARYDSAEEAVQAAIDSGGGALLLADGYPEETRQVDPALLDAAACAGVRLYIEYPAALPDLRIGDPRDVEWERAVVASEFFAPAVEPLRILALGGLRFLDVEGVEPHLVAARVAGFDQAVFGLPEKRHPLLFEHGGALVATTGLSGFVRARFAPRDAVAGVWRAILSWLAPDAAEFHLAWTPVTQATYEYGEPLPPDAENDAFQRGLDWFHTSRLLIHPDHEEVIRAAMEAGQDSIPPPEPDEPVGDGSHGIMQCYLSRLTPDGRQVRNCIRRGDCVCESAMALAFGGRLRNDANLSGIAERLLDHYLFDSGARGGDRADPEHGAYGLIAWGAAIPAWQVANYGDDNARVMLGTLAAATLIGNPRWDEAIMRCMVANYRTTGRTGFRPDRVDMPALTANGWRPYFESEPIRPAPHFEAYLWACFLLTYGFTGYRPLFERTERAIRKTMELYPDGWEWTNGLAQEKARMLLALAWLVRADGTDEQRQWLDAVGRDLVKLQADCGAIREELGTPGKGMFPPPGSNEAYGGGEASLIQANGDPVSDLLYTTNFAFLGLHEAAAATGDALFRNASDRLAKFLCRIQVRTEQLPELDGSWFRAFDYRRWEFWASDADLGWGAWSAMTGWTQTWIVAVLAMRAMGTSLWALAGDRRLAAPFERELASMLPEADRRAAG